MHISTHTHTHTPGLNGDPMLDSRIVFSMLLLTADCLLRLRLTGATAFCNTNIYSYMSYTVIRNTRISITARLHAHSNCTGTLV